MYTSSVNILLVEDNLGDAQLVREYLAVGMRHPYELSHCLRIRDALVHLDKGCCDVILLDLSLPDSTGLASFMTLHERSTNVPIVILTGFNDDVLATQAILNGAKDFLPKNGLDGIALARTVRHAIERGQWEETIRRSEERLSRIERHEAIGRLSAGIAHNFNNIFTAILGHCDLLLLGKHADPQVERRAQSILRATKRAASLTRSLMSFCQSQPKRPIVFDVNGVVSNLQPLLQGSLGKNTVLTIDLDIQAGHVLADPAQLEQVVLNLVVNAREAMAGGGAITIRTMPVEFVSAVAGTPDCVPPGSYESLMVSDTGCGMDSRIASQIFDPFFTTKNSDTSNGMGLATVYGIVGRSHGFIHLISQPGAGTTITLYLPRHHPAMNQGSLEHPRDSYKSCRGSETILLVEDDKELSSLMTEALSDMGYKMFTAANGKEALAIFTEHAESISLLATDVTMPGMSGNELVRHIRHINPTLSVIFMTGYAKEPPEEQDPQARGTVVLMKPFTPCVLASAIRTSLDIDSYAHLPAH